MKDFTLVAYEEYLKAILQSYDTIIRFDDYMEAEVKPSNFCMLRHDVDRKVKNAVAMAKLEASLGMKATYYFRVPYTFEKESIQEIAALGHEIGYHYECLTDANGDEKKAIAIFDENLAKLREIVPIKTISMHGRPLSQYDNRDLWKVKEHHDHLTEKCNILGEIYLDIDYSDILYIGDTGRNWTNGKYNRRDFVSSNIKMDFNSAKDLLSYLQSPIYPKLIFQIHPERWTDDSMEYFAQQMKDNLINKVKVIKSFVE